MSDANLEGAATSPAGHDTPPASVAAEGDKQAGAAAQARPHASTTPMTIGLALGALAAGAVLGLFVVGPQVLAARAHAPVTAAVQAVAPPEAAPGAEHGGKGGAPKAKPTLFKVDNIIVNPAGAQGSHFLMATVVFELPEDKVEERLRDHESQVRDVVVSALENKSMEDLVQPGARDRLKTELAAAVKPIAGNPAWIRVYLPQFVIQ